VQQIGVPNVIVIDPIKGEFPDGPRWSAKVNQRLGLHRHQTAEEPPDPFGGILVGNVFLYVIRVMYAFGRNAKVLEVASDELYSHYGLFPV
jgi:hypothetical protein